MQPDEFAQRYHVSRESMEKISIYHALLLKWQRAINLVGPKTLDDAWERHFADSAQLARFVPDGVKVLVDLGSGAGFPGAVLAIMRPDIDTHLIESDERKAQFLRTVSRETGAAITVHNERIEAVEGLVPGFVTARALADLGSLFGLCEGWSRANPGLEMLFLKGGSYEAEIEAARAIYDFEIEAFPSDTAPEARMLFIRHLKVR